MVSICRSFWAWPFGGHRRRRHTNRDDTKCNNTNCDDEFNNAYTTGEGRSGIKNFNEETVNDPLEESVLAAGVNGDNSIPTVGRSYGQSAREETVGYDREGTLNGAIVSHVGCGEGRIIIIRGDVHPFRGIHIRSIEQCRECLDRIGVLLSKQSLGWQHVRKMTAYLVSSKCTAVDFRAVMNEYPFPKDNSITTVLFVQELEMEHAVVQVEVIASAR